MGVTPEEMAAWRAAAEHVLVPYDAHLGVHAQAEGFTAHEVWDFASTKEDEYPLLLHYPYFDLYRKQVVKQADLVLAMHLRGDAFSDEQKARDFDYYERLTVRDSSLSACTQAVIAAEVGHLELAYDQRLGVHQQSEGFTDHELWDFASTKPEQYPLLLHFPYFDLYRKQVVKQPDLVLAMQLFSHLFSAEQRARNFDYYERITVRDSSLSACIEAIAAADAGHLRLAFDYAAEAALVDLHDLQRNTSDGLHIASLAGTWIALVWAFGGMRDLGETLSFAPRLPDALTRLAFMIRHRGRCLRVEVTTQSARYSLVRCQGPLRIAHHGEPLVLDDEPIVRPIPPAPERPPPLQPAGREPRHRAPGA